MDFESLDNVKDSFVNGKFDFPDEFNISGIKYKLHSSPSFNMEQLVKNENKAIVAYSTSSAKLTENDDSNLEQLGLRPWVLFTWKLTENKLIVPHNVRTANLSQKKVPVKENSPEDNFIGSVVEVRVTGIGGVADMQGKIDTGADISSLHATKWKIDNKQNVVHFICPELSNNTITTPLVNHQAVKSADGGTEYRPVISLNIKINGKLLSNVLFNLNDRGQMQHPILIGKNALQAGKFKIDPSLDESSNDIDWDKLQEQLDDDQPTTKYFTTTEIVELLNNQ